MDVNTCTAHSSQLQGDDASSRAREELQVEGWYPSREYVRTYTIHELTPERKTEDERRRRKRRGKAGYPAPASSEREYDAGGAHDDETTKRCNDAMQKTKRRKKQYEMQAADR